MKSIYYSLYLALSNRYLEGTIKSLEPKIFIEKVEILFYKIENSE